MICCVSKEELESTKSASRWSYQTVRNTFGFQFQIVSIQNLNYIVSEDLSAETLDIELSGNQVLKLNNTGIFFLKEISPELFHLLAYAKLEAVLKYLKDCFAKRLECNSALAECEIIKS